VARQDFSYPSFKPAVSRYLFVLEYESVSFSHSLFRKTLGMAAEDQKEKMISMETRSFQEGSFFTSDEIPLYFRYWPATQGHGQKVIVLFHRGHEHSGRLQHVVDELMMPDTHFYAWDARGHGQSPGERGYSPSLARSVRDVDEFVRFVAEDANVDCEDIIVIAQSVGAVLVSTWVHAVE